MAIVFAPVSIVQTEDRDSENKATHRSNPTELFEAFKEQNRSSMRTRLNESLEEIRVAGWTAPFTLFIKGPLEEMEVIKEAWRRHFLRSPVGLLIREIGKIPQLLQLDSLSIDTIYFNVPSLSLKYVIVNFGSEIRPRRVRFGRISHV